MQVSYGDALPNSICNMCYKILKQCFNFKKMCEESQIAFKQLLTDVSPIYMLHSFILEGVSGYNFKKAEPSRYTIFFKQIF